MSMNDESRASWTSESERALLEIRAEKSVQEQVDATCRDSTVYGMLGDGLKERGIIRNKRQVINKLKYLRKKYMDLLMHNKTSGRSRKTIPNEGLLYLIWGARPSATPLRLVSSSASMVKRRVSLSPASSSLSSSSASTSTIMSVSDSDDESDLEVEPVVPEAEGDEVGEADAEGQDSDGPDPHPVARPAPDDEAVDDANSDNVEELAPAPARGDPKKEDTPKAPYKLTAIKKKKHNKSKLEKSCESMASLLKDTTSDSHALFQASEDRRAEEQRKWERVLASENRESQQKIVDSFNNVQLQTMTIFQQMMGMLTGHHNAGPSHAGQAAPWPNAAPGPNAAPTLNAAPWPNAAPTPILAAPWQNAAPTPILAPWQNAAPGPSHTATGHNAAPGPSRTASGHNAAPGPSHTASGHNAAPGPSRTASGPNAAPGPSYTAPRPNISQEMRHPSMRSVFPSPPSENPNLFSCSPGMESLQEYHRDVPATQQNTGLEEENHYTER